jgi:hypothetical protein
MPSIEYAGGLGNENAEKADELEQIQLGCQ